MRIPETIYQMPQYKKSITYGFLALISLWAFVDYYLMCFRISLGHLGFGLLFTLSLFGFLKYGKVGDTTTLNHFFQSSRIFERIFTLPFLVTEMYAANNILKEFCYIHAMLPIFVYIPISMTKPYYRNGLDAIIFVSCVSLMCLSIFIDNLYGVVASVLYAILQFNITNHGEIMGIPSMYIYNFGLAAFTYTALEALKNNKYVFV